MAYSDILGMNPAFVTKTTYNDSRSLTALPRLEEDTLGLLRWQIDPSLGIRCLRFVGVAASSTADVADGDALAFDDKYKRSVTNDVSDADRNQPAGVGIGAITIGNKGWIQCYGYHDAIKTSGGDNIVDGDSLILSATDRTVERVASGTAPTHKIIGVAVTDDVDAANTVEGFIECL